MKTIFPVQVCVKWQGNEFLTPEGAVSDGGYKILKTEAGEGILLVMKRQKEELFFCSKFFFSDRQTIAIGSDFCYEIFYEYYSFFRERKILVYREKEKYILECISTGEERTNTKIYVNERPVKEKVFLEKGDRIEILGLHILFLPQMLICVSRYGVLRMVERKGSVVNKRCNRDYIVRQSFLPQEKVWEETLEIALPEAKKKEQSQPLILTVGPSLTMVIPTLLMMFTGKLFLGQSNGNFYLMTVVVTVASAILSVFWMIINRFYRKKINQQEQKGKEKEYRVYLEKIKTYLEDKYEQNRQRIEDRYPSVRQIIGKEEGHIFWNGYRNRDEEGKVVIRIGSGERTSPIAVKVSERERIAMAGFYAEEAHEIADRFRVLRDVPVAISLADAEGTGFVGVGVYSFLMQMLIQMISRLGGQDVKLIYFYHENIREEKEIAECLKWIPQVWQEGKRKRFIAGNTREAGEILPYLTGKLQSVTESEHDYQTLYFFVIANENLVKGEQLYNILTGKQKGRGYHVIFVGSHKTQMPANVKQMVIKDGEQEELMRYEKGVWERQNLYLEGCDINQAEKYVRGLARIRRSDELVDTELPETVSFLEMYSCHTIEELHILSRWEENDTEERIRVPIGVGEGNRLIYLDIHEKFHGPHGLVAGTTGSGKSELLQTYLLSLAVSFGPEDVNFFIIDYKGGGLGIGLSELLHCAGIISNLSGVQIKRALLSIKSETRRRQQLLSRAGVSHIDHYGKLYRDQKVREPMPHLILVVDEFAELKKEEPAFMQEIISMSQIGRSLGIHLILATQKPAGTIDDKIWSNSRFRLCLRVADKQDSMDMLKRPEAAYLTGAGRGYLQVGNNEIFEVLQTGYSKAAYETQIKKQKAVLISMTGKRYEKKQSSQEGLRNQLEEVADYINNIGIAAGYLKAKKLWMEELPEKLILEECESGAGTDMTLGIGRYDDPYNQKQGEVYYVPSEGHLYVSGMPASGKSTFLQTVLWQVCNKYHPLQAQFLLIALESAAVGCFAGMPHCMGYIRHICEAENFFFHLESLIQQRKKILGGIGFVEAQKRTDVQLCPLFFIIDNYGSFREATEDLYYPLIERIFREGVQIGIYLIVTGLGIGGSELQGRLFEKVKQTLTLAMNDKVQYADILRQYQIPVEPSPDVKGRGLCKIDGKILEFQVSLLADADDYERIEKIEALSEVWKKREYSTDSMPEKFAKLPEKPSWEELQSQWSKVEPSERVFPIGYQIKSGLIQSISMEEHFPFLISGDKERETKRVLRIMVKTLLRTGYGIAVFTKETIDEKCVADTGLIILRNAEGLREWCQWFETAERQEKQVLIIDEPSDLVSIGHELSHKLEMLIKEKKVYLLAKISSMRETEIIGTCWYELFIKKQCGVYIGGNASMQRLLSFDDLGYTQLGKKEPAGVGYLKLGYDSETCKVLFVGGKGEEKNDTG